MRPEASTYRRPLRSPLRGPSSMEWRTRRRTSSPILCQSRWLRAGARVPRRAWSACWRDTWEPNRSSRSQSGGAWTHGYGRTERPRPTSREQRVVVRGLRRLSFSTPMPVSTGAQGVTTMSRLANKNILITGGNSGIGLAAAQEFDREGARVAICGLNERTLQAAKETLGAGSLAVRADVSNLTDLDTMFATIRREFGHLDGVFVNAGHSEFLLFEEVTEQSFDKVIAVNFKGVYF